jgi:Peptidase A4 family
MRMRLLVALASLVLLLVVAGSAGAAGTGGSARQPVIPVQRISAGPVQSVNWAGYAVYGYTFQTATGSWTQPSDITCGHKPTFAAFFVGIDGYTLADPNTTSVEQIGTDVDCFHGVATHYAWYEMYPDPPVNLDTGAYPVSAGDELTATVHYNSGTSFTLTLENTTADWTFSTTVNAPVTPVRSTAEWIAEMPATGGHFWPLTDFGSIGFTGASATNDGGTSHSISGWNNDQIQLVKYRGPFKTIGIACTSSLSGGSFTIDYGSCS